MVAITSVVIEAIVTSRSTNKRSARGEADDGAGEGYQRGHIAGLELPNKSSTVISCQQSPQWKKDVIDDLENATGYTDSTRR